MERKKALAYVIGFFCVIAGIGLLHVIFPDVEKDTTERRALAKFPVCSVEKILDREFSDDMETYLLDQFPFRQQFRSLHTQMRLRLLRQLDYKGLYQDGTHIFQQQQMDERQIAYAAEKIQEITKEHLDGMSVYYSVIPQKNRYQSERMKQQETDRQIEAYFDARMEGIQKISIDELLDLDSFYETDPHWRQEKIYPVAEKICEEMQTEIKPWKDYEKKELQEFHGVYAGQLGMTGKTDPLYYMVSPDTEASAVTSLDFSEVCQVYEPELFYGMDGYDVYLSGAQSILTIENPEASSERELIVFRDSFASSLIPYLVGSYRKITMIDIRYFHSSLLGEYVTFGEQDVLFLYSTLILNQGRVLK